MRRKHAFDPQAGAAVGAGDQFPDLQQARIALAFEFSKE